MDLSYPYKASPVKMALGAVFFGACAAFLAQRAFSNDRGLIINGLIELGVQGATVFFAVLAVLSAAFVAVAAIATVHGMIKKPMLLLTDEHLVVPTGFIRKRPTTIRFAEITRVSMQEVQRQRFLNVGTADRKVAIARSLLPSDAAFDEVVSLIRKGTPHVPGDW